MRLSQSMRCLMEVNDHHGVAYRGNGWGLRGRIRQINESMGAIWFLHGDTAKQCPFYPITGCPAKLTNGYCYILHMLKHAFGGIGICGPSWSGTTWPSPETATLFYRVFPQALPQVLNYDPKVPLNAYMTSKNLHAFTPTRDIAFRIIYSPTDERPIRRVSWRIKPPLVLILHRRSRKLSNAQQELHNDLEYMFNLGTRICYEYGWYNIPIIAWSVSMCSSNIMSIPQSRFDTSEDLAGISERTRKWSHPANTVNCMMTSSFMAEILTAYPGTFLVLLGEDALGGDISAL